MTAEAGKKSLLRSAENWLCIVSLVFLVLVPAADAAMRLFLKTGFPDAGGLMIHLLLAAGILSGMITTRNDEHLSIGLVQNFSTEKVKRRVSVVTHILSAFVVTLIAWAAVSFIRIGLMGRLISGIIPDRFFALIIPIGYAVIAFRFARLCPLEGPYKIIPYLALVLGTFCALPIIGKALWLFEPPAFAVSLSGFFYDLAWYLKIPSVIVLILAAFAGMPLFAVMGGLALILIQASGGEIDVIPNQVYMALTQDGIVPIPLFTITGFLLSESRAGERLVKTFRSLFGWFPGGMIVVTVLICAFFTSFTGASGVTILALGGLLFSVLTDHVKYPERFSVGLLTSTGSIGLLFPPSLPIILVGATTFTNILKLFVGGIIPGIILVASVIAFGIASSVKVQVPREPFSAAAAVRGIRESIFEILLPLFLVAGFFTGLLSIVELGAVSVIYVFIVEVLIHRDIALKDLGAVFSKAVPIIGGVLSIIALSMALSYYIIDTQAPESLAMWMRSTIDSKIVFLLLLNLALLVVGCLMDIFSAILIVLPLVSPLGAAYGIDPVHLGIIFITNLEVGFLTPPVGLNLFLASYRFKMPFSQICRYVLPFLLIQLAVVLLVTYIPALSTFLPQFF
ncbi:MAG: TRAP transporter large permease subunit [Spirochaetaceae bacterium]|jgi:tripartite ATP-independent transporter DctM subunit|nr:TRAP transporter large permease subunit [Spirochaetaceae bacterium]